MAKKADAWKDYKEAALVDMMMKVLPKVWRSIHKLMLETRKKSLKYVEGSFYPSSSLLMNSYHELDPVCETFDLLAKFDPQVAAEIGAPLAQTEKVENRFFFKNSIDNLLK